MARRISDAVAECVGKAIEGLDVLQSVKDSIEWEIAPALLPMGREMKLAYMVAVSIPVPGSVEEDYVLNMKPLHDPHADQATVAALVTELFELCQNTADELWDRMNAQANGHKKSPGGLLLP